MHNSVLAPLFFALFLLSSGVSSDSGCFWLGRSPVCLPHECPEGTTEIARSGKTRTTFAYFGRGCTVYTRKRLCCKNSMVRADPNKHCRVCLNCEKGKCPRGETFLFKQDIEWGITDSFCCDDGTLVFN